MKRSFLNWTRLCAIAVFLAALCVSGCKNTSDDIDEMRTLKIENGVLVSCNREAEYVEIPSSVTKIENNAFYDCNSLKSVSIPNSVTSIGEHAFANCTGLTSIKIPSSVVSIGSGAFSGCGSLTINYAGTKTQWEALKVTLPANAYVFCSDGTFETGGNPDDVQDPNSNPDDIQNPDLNPEQKTCTLYFYPNAPSGTPEAETLEPKTVTVNTGSYYTLPKEPAFSVEGYYFVGWTEYPDYSYYYKPGEEIWIPTELNVPDTYTLYAVWADTTYINGLRIYQNTVVGYVKDELPADLVIPDGVTAIGWRVFSPLSGKEPCEIKSVTIPGSVKIIEAEAFSSCPNLEKVVIKEGQLNEIEYCTFSWCESLRSVELPDNVKIIGKEAFETCPKLESVTMNGVERIEEWAFSNSGLTSVHLPNTLKFIGDSAFIGCDLESLTIPDSVSAENIGEGVFSHCKKLKKVVLPDSWNEIKWYTFALCESLEDVHLPSDLKIIGESAFSECSNLKEVVIPDGVTEIKDAAFYYCKKLSKVTIPNSVKTIGRKAFWLSPLSEIIIPDNATVENSAFSVSTNLRTISLPASLINAGVKFWDIFEHHREYEYPHPGHPKFTIPILDGPFFDCRNIDIILRDGATRIPEGFLFTGGNYIYKSIKIPDGVKTIEEGAFSYVYFDSDIEWPDSVTVFENDALYHSGWGEKLPSKLEYIGEYALGEYCGESITIPGSVKFFGKCAFLGNYLKSVIIERGVTEIPAGAFAALDNRHPGHLEKVEIPDTVTKIGSSAFWYRYNLKEIKFNGTKTQWANNIVKNDGWDSGTGNYIIICTDGTITN